MHGVCTTPPLCTNGECRAACKGMPLSLGSAHPNSTVSATTATSTTSAPPCPCKQGGEKAAPPFGCGSGEAHIQRRMGGAMRMGATSWAPLPPFACGGARQTLHAGCPSLHPFSLPHVPHWGHAQPEGGTRSRGAEGKWCPSPIACEHDPMCHPTCTTPACPTFGCQVRAVLHAGWHVHGGIRRWGVQGSCTWDDAWGHAHTLFPAGVESAPHTSTSCTGCATPHLTQLRAHVTFEWNAQLDLS